MSQQNELSKQSSIVVTGAAGFIGSCMVQYLNEQGYENLILVDDFGVEAKRVNWESKIYSHIIERQSFFDWIEQNDPQIDYVFHLGARTDTTEFNYAIHQELNVDYSKSIWKYCAAKQVPLVYASSAATYGAGELGYDDEHAIIDKLHPLNPYGVSKNEFDKLAILQIHTPPFWAGLKFFNVYGPNEYHKGRMASVIFHSVNQINKEGYVKLFRSHKKEFRDGEQLRDFVYVKDVVKVMYWMMQQSQKQTEKQHSTAAGVFTSYTNGLKNGMYNLGAGKARSFNDLVKSTFKGLDLQPKIEYIDMPEDIRDKYQYYTEANMQKLVNAGYTEPFYSLEEGVDDYVRNYLKEGKIW